MTLYLDTSSLVKLYVDEVGSDEVRDLVAEAAVVATSIVAYRDAGGAGATPTKRRSERGGIRRGDTQLRGSVARLLDIRRHRTGEP
jgi:predicted nucleic acid-binding protein